MIRRLKKWWKYRFTQWVDTGDCWTEYHTVEEHDHAAKVELCRCRTQIHKETGEARVDRMCAVCDTQPLTEFDQEGNLLKNGLNRDYIPPSEDTEPVIGVGSNEQ